MKRIGLCWVAVVSVCLGMSVVRAEITEADVKRLGGPELTPVGAERAGNADGSIPPWTGGLTEIPADL